MTQWRMKYFFLQENDQSAVPRINRENEQAIVNFDLLFESK